MKNNPFIPVTRPYLPPLNEYVKYLKKIWSINQLTNNGPLLQELESKLREYLDVKHVFFVSNGTIAMQLAIKALHLTGEIITTPFSYVATTTSIIWEHCTPVFADIDPKTCCINPDEIEGKITNKTQAILAVHVYGIPCDVERIEKIAKKHSLKVIYDGAHAFGVRTNNTSIFRYGDISTLSFHATKLYHTGEGGAIVTNDDAIAKEISLLRSFGYVNEDYYIPGINAKNSELHAAMGLTNLPHVVEVREKRKEITEMYDRGLKILINSTAVSRPTVPQSTTYNYIYYPLIFSTEKNLLKVSEALNKKNIIARRYFYPSLNKLPYLAYQSCPRSESLATRALCLPLYDSLNHKDVERIITITNKTLI